MKFVSTLIRVLFLALFIFLIANGKTMLWFGVFAASLIAAVIFGRVYCGYACPMNTLMLPTEWISKKLKIQTDHTPKWLSSGNFGWVALVVSIGVMLYARNILHKNIPILLIWLVVAVLVTLRYKPYVFHNLICPFGVLQKVFSRFAKSSHNVDAESCLGCKLCEPVCPSNAIEVKPVTKKAEIETSLCFKCTNCQQTCPTNAIHK